MKPEPLKPAAPKPLRIGETVRYVSRTPYGDADLPALIMSIHHDHTGIRVFTDMSGGSEWPVSTSERDTPTPGYFYREEPAR